MFYLLTVCIVGRLVINFTSKIKVCDKVPSLAEIFIDLLILFSYKYGYQFLITIWQWLSLFFWRVKSKIGLPSLLSFSIRKILSYVWRKQIVNGAFSYFSSSIIVSPIQLSFCIEIVTFTYHKLHRSHYLSHVSYIISSDIILELLAIVFRSASM